VRITPEFSNHLSAAFHILWSEATKMFQTKEEKILEGLAGIRSMISTEIRPASRRADGENAIRLNPPDPFLGKIPHYRAKTLAIEGSLR
jgi:hypothetical protein